MTNLPIAYKKPTPRKLATHLLHNFASVRVKVHTPRPSSVSWQAIGTDRCPAVQTRLTSRIWMLFVAVRWSVLSTHSGWAGLEAEKACAGTTASSSSSELFFREHTNCPQAGWVQIAEITKSRWVSGTPVVCLLSLLLAAICARVSFTYTIESMTSMKFQRRGWRTFLIGTCPQS